MQAKRAVPTSPAPKRDTLLEEVVDLIRENERFALTTHLSPEGDAIGSALPAKIFTGLVASSQ